MKIGIPNLNKSKVLRKDSSAEYSGGGGNDETIADVIARTPPKMEKFHHFVSDASNPAFP